MANTVMTAKNTFAEGLVMDFAPDNTQATTLTSALNATLLTFNGNEMSLQNDMGNGRVETAYLPEGYVPVGTCEFGDIIYIVSYNPITNKSQIGCFPSPERNISSEEINSAKELLSWRDFQEGNDTPTGSLKTRSVKKIIYGEKYLNPGDKYIIYLSPESPDDLQENNKTLSDYGNKSHQHNYWPKLVKVHVVAIDDSGKITYLDSNLKWYDNNYYIQPKSANSDGSADIDSYRSLISSAYSIFQSRISGKLALLIELEQIESFNCTHSVITSKSNNDQNTKFDIYFYLHWQAQHNDISPHGITFCQSEWSDPDEGGKIYKYYKNEDGIFQLNTVGEYIDTPIHLSDYYNNGIYQYQSVIPISKIYELYQEKDITYDDYINNKSYNCNYSKYTEQKFLSQVDSSLVRDSQKVVQLKIDGVPQYSDNGYGRYYINLDAVNDKGQSCTKLSNGLLCPIADISIPDDVINNFFQKDVCKYIASIDINTGLYDEGTKTLISHELSNLIWNYSVAPCMQYGVLDHLRTNGSIDFSKINTGKIELTQWRYYNTGLTSTLSWGLDFYPEPGKNISEVVLEFYDNQGIAAAYHIQGLQSYSGQFTEIITFGSNSNYRLNSIASNGTKICHAGNVVGNYSELTSKTGEYVVLDEKTNKPYFDNDNSFSGTSTYYYLNDAGVLYQNQLYLVKIIAKYGIVNDLEDFDQDSIVEKVFFRWYWTNSLFNDNYYNIFDFKSLSPNITLQNVLQIDGTNIIKNNLKYPGKATLLEESKDQYYNLLQTMITYINQEQENNIKLTVIPYLENYNTFSINKSRLEDLKFDIKIENKSISIPSNIEYEATSIQSSRKILAYPQIDSQLEYAGLISNMPISSTVINNILGTDISNDNPEIYDTEDAYLQYKDSFDLRFKEGQQISTNYYESSQNGIDAVLTGIKFDKLITHNIAETKVNNYKNCSTGDFHINGNNSHLYLKYFWLFNHWEHSGKDGYIQSSIARIENKANSIDSSYSEKAWYTSPEKAHGNSPMMNYSEQELQDVIVKLAADTEGLSIIPWSIACSEYKRMNDWKIGGTGVGKSNLFYSSPEVILKGENNSGSFVAMSLLMKNHNNEIWCPMYDWFKIGYKSYNSQIVLNKDGSETDYTIGDLINSVLYAFVIPDYSNSYVYIPHDYTRLQDYTQSWNADITITQKEIESPKELLIMGVNNGCSLDQYLKLVEQNSNINLQDDSLIQNVDIQIIPTEQTFNFSLGLEYNISQLLEDFHTIINTDQICINDKYYNSEISSGNLGVINGNTVSNKQALGAIPIYNRWKQENGALVPIARSKSTVDDKKTRVLASRMEYNSTRQILELDIDSITNKTTTCWIDQNNAKTDDGGGIRCIDYQLLNTYNL